MNVSKFCIEGYDHLAHDGDDSDFSGSPPEAAIAVKGCDPNEFGNLAFVEVSEFG